MLRRIALAVLSLVIVCVLLEVVLRTTHLFNARLSWNEPDPLIAWRFTPGREYWYFAENDHAITGRINAAGWRDHDRAGPRPPATTRIAVLGDSFVEAFQVELDSTFVAIAERQLNEQGGAYELMNFGRSGMSPAEELLVLERDILPREPNTVLLLFTPQNDIADVNPETAPDARRPFFRPVTGDSLALDTGFVHRRDYRMREAINPFKQQSALISLLSERYNLARRLKRARNEMAAAPVEGIRRELQLCTAGSDSVFAANYALCKKLIARMHALCSAHGIRFVLTAVPVAYQDDEIRKLLMTDASFDPDYFDRDLASFAGHHGFVFVPLSGAFEARSRASGRALHWEHWNYEGHRLAGTLIAPVVGDRPAGAAAAGTSN